MTKLVPLLAIMALFLGLVSVAHAQTTTTPTVSSVAITSNPGADNTYATGDTVTVSLTFSEAVTVTGTPYVVVDIGGQPRNFKYSGDGSSAAAQPFSYTVLVGDRDADGVSLQVNSLTLNGGTIQATDDSTNATLTHCGHDVRQPQGGHRGHAAEQPQPAGRIRHHHHQRHGERHRVRNLSLGRYDNKQFDINAITLDVKTPSDTLNVTVEAGFYRRIVWDWTYTYTGSVTAAGLQTFTLSGPPACSFGNVGNYSRGRISTLSS